METRNMSGVSIPVLMSRCFDLVTGNSLKSALPQDNLLRSQVMQATTQTPATRAKTARPKGPKITRCRRAENQGHEA